MREAYHWYQERRDGLGAEFIATVEACLTSIQSRPLAFPMVFDKVRRALLRRFPYGIFFVMEQDIITVLACFHARRAPARFEGAFKRSAVPDRTEKLRARSRSAGASGATSPCRCPDGWATSPIMSFYGGGCRGRFQTRPYGPESCRLRSRQHGLLHGYRLAGKKPGRARGGCRACSRPATAG
jgi:hypothetical protein